jgi:hypothetical protein
MMVGCLGIDLLDLREAAALIEQANGRSLVGTVHIGRDLQAV